MVLRMFFLLFFASLPLCALSTPLSFIENRGQTDGEVAYYVRGMDKTLYFTPRSVTVALKKENPKGAPERWIVKLEFLGADTPAPPEGRSRRDRVVHYFKGPPEDWKRDVPLYGEIVYHDLWPGIDLVYAALGDRIKYHFVVKPGADPRNIRIRCRGASGIALTEEGGLEVSTPLGALTDDKPLAYQWTEERRREVPMDFILNKKMGTFGFQVGEFDSGLTLFMDPAIMVYCGYIGGSGYDEARDIAVDGQGNAYITGWTDSLSSTFPVAAGPDLTYNGGKFDAFVAKVDAAGEKLLYCGYIGGAEEDLGVGIAVDGSGCAYMAGCTFSDEKSFPVTAGPDLTYNGAHSGAYSGDAFVAKITADGTALVYCGYIGGAKQDGGFDIAVDDAGCAYVTGEVYSDEQSFPIVKGPDLTFNGAESDAFVAKVGAKGMALDYCGYIGGAEDEEGIGIFVDEGGRAYLCGWTFSDPSTFPVALGPCLSYQGKQDCFVARVNGIGTQLEYCGYIGGAEEDMAFGIAADGAGGAYVTGYTWSDASSFPVITGPGLTYHPGGRDAFAAKVSPEGKALEYCGYIGGEDSDSGSGIAVDAWGYAYVTGVTASPEQSFPVKVGPDLTFNGGYDAFVARVSKNGTILRYCGYLGGDQNECGWDIALDGYGIPHVAGNTNSGEASFPALGGPDLTYNGGGDVFVAKVTQGLGCDCVRIIETTGGRVHFDLTAGTAMAHRNYILLAGVSGIWPGTYIPGAKAKLPLNWDAFTNLALSLYGTPIFSQFLGKLDASGRGAAMLDTLGSLPPGSAGITLYFAYALNQPWDFTSNAVATTIVP